MRKYLLMVMLGIYFNGMGSQELNQIFAGMDLNNYAVCFTDPDYNPQKFHDEVRHLLSVNQEVPLQITIKGNVPNRAFSALYKNGEERPRHREVHITFQDTESIGSYALSICESFDYNLDITKLNFQNTLKTIGEGAFSFTNINSIHFPDSVTTLGQKVCQGCPSLTEVKLSNNIQIIPENAFNDCKHLHKIHLPKNLHVIEKHAFHKTDLINVTLPKFVQKIEQTAFDYCCNLTTFYAPSVDNIPNFLECSSLKRLTVSAHAFFFTITFFHALAHHSLTDFTLICADSQNDISQIVPGLSQRYWDEKRPVDKGTQKDDNSNPFNCQDLGTDFISCFKCPYIYGADDAGFFLTDQSDIQDFSTEIEAISKSIFPEINSKQYETDLKNNLETLILQEAANQEDINQKADQCIFSLNKLCQTKCAKSLASNVFINLIGGQSELSEYSESHYRNTHSEVPQDDIIQYFYDLFTDRRLKIAFRILAGLPWVHLLSPAFESFYMNHSQLAFIPACVQSRLFAEKGKTHSNILNIIKNDDIDGFLKWKAQVYPNNDSIASQSLNQNRIIDLVIAAGSVKIFKNLVLNDQYDSILKRPKQSLICAILGGNNEIVRTILQRIDVPSVAQSAAIWAFIFQRYDIMDYFLENYLNGQRIYDLLPSTHRFSQFAVLSDNDSNILLKMNSVDENIDPKLLIHAQTQQKWKKRAMQHPLSKSYSLPALSDSLQA